MEHIKTPAYNPDYIIKIKEKLKAPYKHNKNVLKCGYENFLNNIEDTEDEELKNLIIQSLKFIKEHGHKKINDLDFEH